MWYAFLAINYLFVQTLELFTTEGTSWEILHGIKTGFIFLSLVMNLCVSRRYRYRLRDEVVNEQHLIEEIYEREIYQHNNIEDNETESNEPNDESIDESYLEREGLLGSKQCYGSILK